MARPTKKWRPKTRKKRWDNPNLNNNFETKEEDDGIIQNAKNKETKDEMNLDMKEDTKGKEMMQFPTRIQKYSGSEEHTCPN